VEEGVEARWRSRGRKRGGDRDERAKPERALLGLSVGRLVGGLLLLEALGVFAIGDMIIPIVLVLIGLFLVFRAFSSDRTPRPHA
jgi:hypothetical protein